MTAGSGRHPRTEDGMAELHTKALPLLPLSTGVVLPSMVVTLALDSDEAVAETEPTDRTRELTRELRAVISAFAERRRSRRMPEALGSTTDPATLVDAIVGVWSDLPVARKIEALETLDLDERLTKVTAWA